MLVRLASAPLRFLPETAARLPAMLRELGERRRAIPPARRTVPNPALALGALTGSLTSDEVLRTRYLNLLAASMDRATAGHVHPGFLAVLRQMTPDETRIFSRFESDGPYPVLSIQSHPKHGGSRRTELRHFSLLGEEAGCEHPQRAPMYLDNLCRLGLTELRPTRLSEDTRMFKPLESHAEVTSLMARIASRPPVPARRATAGMGMIRWWRTSNTSISSSRHSDASSTTRANIAPRPTSSERPRASGHMTPESPTRRTTTRSRSRSTRPARSGRCSRAPTASRRSRCCRATRPRSCSSA